MPQRPPSRRQQQAAARERRERQTAAQIRRRRRQNITVIGGAIVAAGVLFGLVALSIHNRSNGKVSTKDLSVSPTDLTATATATSAATADTTQTSTISGVTFFTGLTNAASSAKITYDPVPPVGGSYNPVWLNCGIYNDPVPNEYAVHALERGAVWITYQPGLDTKSVNALMKVANTTGGSIALSPYTGLTSPVVVTAWGVQLKLTDATDPRLAQFVTTYRHYAKAPEPNAGCTGGIGQPRGTVVTVPTAVPSVPSTDVAVTPGATNTAQSSPVASSTATATATAAP